MAEPALAPSTLAAPTPLPAVALQVVPSPPPPAGPRLEIPRYDLAGALRLSRELGVSHVLAQILVRRGLSDPQAAREFLDCSTQHPPAAFAGLPRAVAAIERQVAQAGRITVHGDYDVDGVCATAVMVRALQARGAQADWFLPSRTQDGYGLTGATLSRLAARGTKLLLTVDCGITAVEEVELARQAGIEVVITDHHRPRPDGRLPDCPILHPAVCGYPCPELCATAVAYKLALALGSPTAQEDLDLVALATVADLMPLRDENRYLVRAGLRALAGTAKVGLRALMEVARCDPSALDSGTLGFRLAPRINAAGRLARADAALELLLCSDPARARQIAQELDGLNAERRSVEERITWEAEAQVAELGARPAYVLAGQGWHPGVIGIVASRIVEAHHRPAILIALDGDAPAQGSGRSIPGFDLLGALGAGVQHLERYGGHRAAAGLTMRPDAVDEFRAAVEAHAQARLTDDLLQPVEAVDAIVSGSCVGLGLAEELERLEPSGLGAPRPRLLVPGARLQDCRAMGDGRHARFTVVAGGIRTPAVAFGCGGRLQAGPDDPVDASFRLERNCFNGAVEPRLILRHAWPCDPRPVSVLDPEEDYLAAVAAELGRPLALEPAGAAGDAAGRAVLDRRGESPLSVLADTAASGEAVLAVCADVPRRLAGLQDRAGGFSLISYPALERMPQLAARFDRLVVLDPPAGEIQAALLEVGAGFTLLAWGEPELRFAQQMHELEYGLRSSLAALYRALRPLGEVRGDRVEALLRGDGRHGRPARLAGRLLRVLTELELVHLDATLPALAVVSGAGPTSLERSPAYRAYTQRYEDGRKFLSAASPRPSG
jgi:single-stranded-DNA-specific exonuclease